MTSGRRPNSADPAAASSRTTSHADTGEFRRFRPLEFLSLARSPLSDAAAWRCSSPISGRSASLPPQETGNISWQSAVEPVFIENRTWVTHGASSPSVQFTDVTLRLRVRLGSLVFARRCLRQPTQLTAVPLPSCCAERKSVTVSVGYAHAERRAEIGGLPRGSTHRLKLTYLCTFRLRAQGSNRWRQASLWTRVTSRPQCRTDSLHKPSAPKISGTQTPCTTSRNEGLRSLIFGCDLPNCVSAFGVCGLQIARSPFACHGVSAPASKLSRNMSAKWSASLLRSLQSLRSQMCELVVACCKDHPG